MNDVEIQVNRLNKIRTKIDEIKGEKMRLTGELTGHKKRRTDLEKECKEKFGIAIEELPKLVEQLQKDVETNLSEAEKILGGK